MWFKCFLFVLVGLCVVWAGSLSSQTGADTEVLENRVKALEARVDNLGTALDYNTKTLSVLTDSIKHLIARVEVLEKGQKPHRVAPLTFTVMDRQCGAGNLYACTAWPLYESSKAQ